MSEYLATLKGLQWGPNTAYEYLVAAAIFLGTIAVLKIVQLLILSKLRDLAEKTRTDLDDVLIDVFRQVKPPFYALVAVYFAVESLTVPEVASGVVKFVFVATLLYEVVRAVDRLLNYFVDRYFVDTDGDGIPDEGKSMVNGFRTIIRIVLWMIGIALALSNLGIDVTSLIAGLGIGGIAVALALQNILGDMFSSFSIYLDKPFKVGDFIIIGSDAGTVEHIGLKSTRIRTLQGEELVVSNNELTSVRVQNFKKMERRRVVVTLGVEYGTPSAKLREIPGWMNDIVGRQELAEFDRCHFDAYADSSLNYELVFYVDTDDYNAYMDVKQSINFAVYDKFAAEGIEFAFPTRTVHVVKGGE